MAEPLDVDIRFQAAGNARSEVQALLAGTQQLTQLEKDYYTATEKRLGTMQQSLFIQKQLIQAGLARSQEDRDYEARQRHLWGGNGARGISTAGALAHGNFGQAAISGMLGTGSVGTYAGLIKEGIQHGIETATRISNISQNTSLTDEMKGRGVGRALGLGWLIDFVDAIDGTTEKMRKLNEEIHPQRMQTIAIEAEARQRAFGITMQGAPHSARAGLLDSYLASGQIQAGQRFFDESTVGGARAQERYERLRPLELALQRARIETEVARRVRGVAGQGFSDSEAAFNRSQRDLLGYAGNRAGGGIAGELGKAYGAVETGADVENRRREMLERRLELQKAEVGVAEKLNQERQVEQQILKESLSLLKERIGRQESLARGVGGMNPMEREAALESLKIGQSIGFENLPAQARALAGRLAPQTVGKYNERVGNEFLRSRGIYGLEEGDDKDLAALRRERSDLSQNLEIRPVMNEAALERDISKSFNSLGDIIVRIIKSQLRDLEVRIMAGLTIKNANQR